MGWIDQREHIKNIPIDVLYRILRAGLSSEHVADILSCSTVEDLQSLNWLPEKPFGKLVGDSPMIESAQAYKTWDSTGQLSTQPYNINSNYSRKSTGYRMASSGENVDAVITGTHSADMSQYVRWGWNLNDTNANGGTISLAEDIGGNHTFVFFNGVSRNAWVKGIKEDGSIVDMSGNWTFDAEGNSPAICVDGFFDGKHHYGTFGVGINTLLGSVYLDRYNGGIHDGWIRNSMSGKVFLNDSELAYYLRTGDDSRALNGDGETPTGDLKNWFIDSKIYRCIDSVKSGSTLQQTNKSNFYYPTSLDLTDYAKTRPIAGYVLKKPTTTSPMYNIEMVENPSSTFDHGYEIFGTETREDIETFDNMRNVIWAWNVPFDNSVNDYYYYGDNITNIPIFATRQQCLDYFNGLIDYSKALNGGGKYAGADSEIGNKKDKSTIRVNSFGGIAGCVPLYSGVEGMRAFIDAIYNETEGEIDDILEGLKLNGETPLSFVLDAYKMPFDISPFITGTPVSSVHFGLYEAHLTNPMNYASVSTPQTMFTAYISPSFNDFRDYLAQYYLYLPYTGIHTLEVEQWLYHTMSCEVAFDIFSGGIKYYLMCDGIVVNTFEFNPRISLPIMGTDNYTASRNKIDATMGAFSGVVGGAVQGASSGWRGIPSALANVTGSAINSALDLTKATPKSIAGNVNGSASFHDEMTAYLIIEQSETKYGFDITSQYGLPDNRMGVIGGNSGFVQADDIILTGCVDCSEDEKNKIKSLILEGIYV